MYHPAAALHNPGLRPVLEKDFQNLPTLLTAPPAPVEKEEAEQLKFF
jgi:hypothetical protein